MSSSTDALSLNSQASSLSELAALHATRLQILALVSSGSGNSNSNGTQPIDTIKRPWLDPPEGSVTFDQSNTMVVPLPAIGTEAVVVSMVVPDGMDGVINAWSWNFTGGGFTQGSGDISVQMLRNAAAVRNFENVLVEKGSIQIPRPVSPIRIWSGQTINIVVAHDANVTLNGNVVGSLLGYFYPSKG